MCLLMSKCQTIMRGFNIGFWNQKLSLLIILLIPQFKKENEKDKFFTHYGEFNRSLIKFYEEMEEP